VATLSRELSAAQAGLCNLKNTYQDDSRMLANLDVLIERTATEVGKAEQMLQQYNQQNSASVHMSQPRQIISRSISTVRSGAAASVDDFDDCEESKEETTEAHSAPGNIGVPEQVYQRKKKGTSGK
jgi:hypothetical protein